MTESFLAENFGTIITVGGSVMVAIIGGGFALWAKNHTPKQVVPIQDVWAENRTMRNEIRDLENAFDVAFRWMERAIRDWNTGRPLPEFTREDEQVIGKIRHAPDTHKTKE